MTGETVHLPRGFRAAGVTAGLKASGSPDLALVVNDGPDHAGAAVFTTNRVEAAPVTWSRQDVTDGRVDAVVLNSGGANACTGPQGFADTHRTAEHVAQVLAISPGDVVVCSTGLIGELLPMDTLLAGVDAAAGSLTPDGLADAAVAIKTTDTVHKVAGYSADGWSVAGMAKGAGMLAPALATMLVVLTTDAVGSAPDLAAALRSAAEATFDRIDSDGCMSTNDQVSLLVSGASGVTPDAGEFRALLAELCDDLAAQLQEDAEGASHDITIEVVHAASESDAVDVGRSVARNNLFKAAIFGNDPNWGRVLAAIGTTQAPFDPYLVDVAMNGVRVCHAGRPDAPREQVDLTPRATAVLIELHAGEASATIRTNDLTHDYVHENSAYAS